LQDEGTHSEDGKKDYVILPVSGAHQRPYAPGHGGYTMAASKKAVTRKAEHEGLSCKAYQLPVKNHSGGGKDVGLDGII